MARDKQSDGKKTDITPGFGGIGQDAYRIQYQWGPSGYSTGIVQGTGADWFGPLNPMNPVAPPEVAGRVWDFPSGYNLELTPRPYEPIKFSDMRGLADGYDILRLIIETRKDQMERLTWTIRPKTDVSGDPMCDAEDPTLQEIYDFFQTPDGKKDWNLWLRELQ